MILLKDYIKQLIKIKNQHPSFGNLPVVYASDDEGNSYQKVSQEPGLFAVEDIAERNLEALINGEDVGTEVEDFNCVIIN